MYRWLEAMLEASSLARSSNFNLKFSSKGFGISSFPREESDLILLHPKTAEQGLLIFFVDLK